MAKRTSAPATKSTVTITLPRVADTKNYAKFALEAGGGQAFGAVYIPLADAEGLTAFVVTAKA